MRRLPALLLLMLAVPVVAFGVAHGFLGAHERAWQASLARHHPDVSVERRSAVTLRRACGDAGFRADNAEICALERRLAWMRGLAVAGGVGGVAWLGLIAAAGRWATRSRRLLLAVFRPGLHLTSGVVIATIALQAALAIAAFYLLESWLVNRVHVGLLAGVAVAALVGVYSVARASLSVVQTATTTVVGRRLNEEEQPALWSFVRETAKAVKAVPPHHVVAGLDVNFFVTESPVQTLDARLRGRTMFVSLPLARILTRDELRAIVGHELGHYKGDDTVWSRKFYPIYRGTWEALGGLARGVGQSLGSLILLPAIGLLSYFLECFAIAENGISRERELAADKLGAGQVGPAVAASALVKVHAYAGCWGAVQTETGEALEQGRPAPGNASLAFSTLVAGHATPASLDDLAGTQLHHPTDSHPPLGVRLQSLGIALDQVRSAALDVSPAEPAVTLLRGYEHLERDLTAAEAALMAHALGIAPPRLSGAPVPAPARARQSHAQAHALSVDAACGRGPRRGPLPDHS